MTPRLVWTGELLGSLQRATGGQIKQMLVNDTVDPLKKLLIFQMHELFRKGDYNAFARMVHFFARANDCEVGRLWRYNLTYRAEIFIKRRLGPAMDRNPILQEKQR